MPGSSEPGVRVGVLFLIQGAFWIPLGADAQKKVQGHLQPLKRPPRSAEIVRTDDVLHYTNCCRCITVQRELESRVNKGLRRPSHIAGQRYHLNIT